MTSPLISIQESANHQSNQDQSPGPVHIEWNVLIRNFAAEAIGSFIMVFCIAGILASMEIPGTRVGLMEYAITGAFTIILLVISLGSISGAHVNPAITIAFAAVGPFPWSKVPIYVLGQIGGCVMGTYAGSWTYGIKSELLMTKPLNGNTAAFVVEFIATMFILFVIASLADDTQNANGHLPAFVAGVAIGLGVIITGPTSGGSMNPARSFGPALVSWDFDQLWIYLVAPTAGSISGGLLYRILRLQGWSSK